MKRFVLAALAGLALPSPPPLAAQSAPLPGSIRPGRAAGQPIDEAYTKKIKEYTTEPFFLSPLVDYLPASKTVPTPAAVLGDIAGAPTKLPYSAEVYQYFRMVAKATPRVRVYSIGKTEEGREMIAVAVASEAIMARLDRNRELLAKLADPRGTDDATADRAIQEAVPVYYITGTIHSPESGAPTAMMELAYRLAVDESPYVRNIRDHLVTLITPIVEVDGRDRQVDLFKWHEAHPNETYPDLIYWGHYVAHDNNRDAMGMTLKLSQNVLDTYLGWKAQVIHDLHESVPYLYDNTIGDGPYNAWLDPLLTNEWHQLGWHNVQEMTRMGMPGVFAFGNFDTWSPGYLMFMAATHNGISRLYETFGNGMPETMERTLSPDETSRTWYRQNPPLPRARWSLRNNNNYEQTGVLISLAYFADNREVFLRNFFEKSKRSVAKARVEGPAAYVLPANDARPGAQAELLRVLVRQHVEISRATAPFTVALPAKKAKDAKADTGKAAPLTREFPAKSYVIRMDQPYSRIADALLDYQYWAPEDPQKTPYDDTGWTFPEGFAVEAVRVVDPKILTVPMERVTGPIAAPGGVTGDGVVFAINHNADNALVTLRYRLETADIQAAEQPFESGGRKFARGSFLIRNVPAATLDRVTRELGLSAYGLAAAPEVKTHPLRAARVAIVHDWINTQTEGWWRLAFDNLSLPYTYISVQDVAATADLNAKFDVILFPPSGTNPALLIAGMPMYRNPMPWKQSSLTPNLGTFAQSDDIRPGLGWQGVANLDRFVRKGGVLVGVENTATFAVETGLAAGVGTVSTSGRIVGTLLRSRIVDSTSPIVYGIGDSLAVLSADGSAFALSSLVGRGFRRPSDRNGRPTGRGRSDETDSPQGRAPLDPRFEAPARATVEPWQAAPVPDEEMLNPLTVIPVERRPRVALRFADHKELLVSGLLDGGSDVAQRPIVVETPLEKGHVVLFSFNPIYRGETLGSYFLVFNAMLNFDALR